jgi:hypothetical protein
MKSLISLAILLVMSSAQAQDDHFEYSNPFGSDGFNNPSLTAEERNYVAEDELWGFYLHTRSEIVRVQKEISSGKAHTMPTRVREVIAYGNLLESMAELRAFSRQHPEVVFGSDKDEIAKIDSALRSLGVRYVADQGQSASGRHEWSGQFIVDYCDKVGPDKIASELRPLLYQADGKLRLISRSYSESHMP